MYPHLDEIFRQYLGLQLTFRFHSFGVMIATAVGVAAWLCKLEFDRMYAAELLGSVAVRVREAKGRVHSANVSPSKLIPNMVIIAAVTAIAGGMQPWSSVRDGFRLGPIGTFYGGLICSSLAVAAYVLSKRLSVARVLDAVAPGLMLAYAIGRIGCYLAGDGDWGLCSSLANKPGWLPAFLWSETFPRNILGVDVLSHTAAALQKKGLPSEQCAGADGVFPTMLYEAMLATALFVLLWRVRRHPFQAGWLFSLYLILNGAERFLIEIIRINQNYLFGLSQAQVIGLSLVALGVLGFSLTMQGRSRRTPTNRGLTQ
jgi:phosphatidylglycerol:prolipoprotein diacylglycerol transferase